MIYWNLNQPVQLKSSENMIYIRKKQILYYFFFLEREKGRENEKEKKRD